MNEQDQKKDNSIQNQDENLPTWAVFVRLIIEIADKLIWLFVLFIIAAIIGTFVVVPSLGNRLKPSDPIITLPPPVIDVTKLNSEIRKDLENARQQAKQFASNKLDVWVDELMVKVDDSFLPWYFGYWNQQFIGIQSLFQTGYHWLNGNTPTAEEKLNQIVQSQFTNLVLQPKIAQLEIETLTDETRNVYINTLKTQLNITKQNLNIPESRWQRYLQDISLVTRSSESNRGTSLAFKSAGSTAIAGGVILAKTSAKTFGKFAGKSVGKITGKTVGKMLGKAGGVASEALGEAVAVATAPIVGPILGIGIVAWDLIDHYQTRKVNEPILRSEIKEYFTKMEANLLNDRNTGIMSPIYDLEVQVFKSLSHS
jgi:hypothetical protein